MTSRILPPDEYPRLAGTEAEGLIPHLSDAARVVVVEQDDQILGCHVLVPIVHAECLWIHPAYRKKGSVARRLWTRVRQEVTEHFHSRSFATGAMSDDVRTLLAHVHATKLPGDHYLVEVSPCPLASAPPS